VVSFVFADFREAAGCALQNFTMRVTLPRIPIDARGRARFNDRAPDTYERAMQMSSLPENATMRRVSTPRSPRPESLEPVRDADRLTPREREIVRLVAKGLPNKQIAAVLEMSPWTVSSHLRLLFAKYGVASRAALVATVMTPATKAEEPRKK
jgi:DNA-binding CsgD family transcriptional regulator